MATSGGPNIINGGLVFGYDTGDVPLAGFDNRVDKRRYFAGKPMTNFYSDGHFPNGNDMSSENGSNSTNEIVLLENPGESPYVLKQTGNSNTEYEIRLTNELVAGTTYVMSGWYAESLDYVGDSRMFHARANGTPSAITTGAGFYNQIKSKVVGGLEWKFGYKAITTPSGYNNTFHWYLGYGGSSYTGARYYTNIKMEVGQYPSPYHPGTRSSTQSLIDLKGNTNIDVDDISFNSSNGQIAFDGTDDYLNLGNSSLFDFGQNGTIEAVLKPTNSTGNDRIWCIDNNSSNLDAYLNGSTYNVYLHGGTVGTTTALTQNQYNHLVVRYDNGTIKIFVNGAEGTMTGTQTGYNIVNNSGNNSNLYLGCYRNLSYNLHGDMPIFRVYSSPLTSNEIEQNYKVYKKRFGI